MKPKNRLKGNDDEYSFGHPLRNLWSKVIHREVEDIKNGDSDGRFFFYSDYSRFEWICDMLGFNADSIRKNVFKTKY